MQKQISLEEVKRAFEQWRLGKVHQRERVPNELRIQVKAIAHYYSRRQILNELSISNAQMERYVVKNKNTESYTHNAPPNEFIEVPMPRFLKEQHKPASALSLTITRGNGSSWILSEATHDVISESLRLFLQG